MTLAVTLLTIAVAILLIALGFCLYVISQAIELFLDIFR